MAGRWTALWGAEGLASWRRAGDDVARTIGRVLPGIGVTGLCVAVVATLVVPAVIPSGVPATGSELHPHGAAPVHAALVSTTATKVPPGCTTSATTITCVYQSHGTDNYTATTNGTRPLQIPANVDTVHVQANGAIGGGEGHGDGGVVSGTLQMTLIRTRTLRVVAGGNGKGTTTGGTGGQPYGGSGGSGHTRHGSGGGGLTGVALAGTVTVFFPSPHRALTPYDVPLILAGAGGGTGSYGAGNGWSYAGSGGASGTGGDSGSYTWCFGKDVGGGGGGGATQSAGGGGGSAPNGCSPGGGGGGGGYRQGGNGGNGAGAAGSGGGGGGGGAGWYGGGGGGGGGTDGSGGGGGGGASNVHGTGWVTNVVYTGGNGTKSAGYAYLALSWPLRSTSTSLVISSGTGGPALSSVPAGYKWLTLTASLTSTARGAVDFTETGTAISATTRSGSSCTTVPVIGGTATCTVRTPASLGQHAFVGTFQANAAFAASSGTGGVTVVQDQVRLSTVRVTPTTGSGVKLVVTVDEPPYAPNSLAGGLVTYDAQAAGAPTAQVACTQTISSNVAQGKSVKTVTCPRFTAAVPGTAYTLTAKFTPKTGTLVNSVASTPNAFQYTVTKATPAVTLSVSPSSVSFGQRVTLQATVSGLPSADRPPAAVTYEGAGGTPITCTGTGQQNPAAVTTGNGVTSPCTFTPGTGGTTTVETVVAVYPGDRETNAAQSSPQQIKVAKASSTTVVTVTPAGGVGAVGVPVTLTARVADGTDPTAVAAGTVEFEQRTASTGATAPVPGCTAVAAKDGVATCPLPASPAGLATLTFGAVYCPTGTGGACTDWIKSSAKPVAYTPVKDPTTVTLAPAGTQTHPQTVTTPTLTVTATVRVAVPTSAQTPPVTGTVGFQQNGQPVGGSCGAVPVGAGTGQAVCTFAPVAGAEDAVTATFVPATGSLTTGAASTPAYYKVAGLPTATALTVAPPTGDPTEYGVPLTATATVTSNGTAVTAGTVAFAVDGSPVATCASQAVSAQGIATCVLPPLAAGSPHAVVATFAYAGGTYQRSTATRPVTVTAAPTTTTLALTPDVTTPGDDVLTATVTNAATGARAPPTGAVAFTTTGGSVVASCNAVPLAAASGPVATATCALPRPMATATYAAAFTPTPPADLTASKTTAPLSFTPGGSCSTAFQGAWNDGGKALKLSVGGASAIGDVTVDVASPVGTCSPTRVLPFSGGTLQLFGSTLAGSTGLAGYLVDGQGSGAVPQVCVDGGTLHLPSGWSLGTVALSSSEKLCLDLTSVSGTTGTVGGLTGALAVSTSALPVALPGNGYQLVLTFAAAPAPTMTVHLGPVAPPAATPYLTATVTVTDSSGTVTAKGAVAVGDLPFLSGAVGATVTVTTTTGKITWAVSLAVPATRTYAPVPGVVLKSLSLALSSSSGLTAQATAVLGTGTAVTVHLTGSYSGGKWTLTLAPTRIGSWTPTSGLTLSPTLAGTLTITTGGASTAVTYDFETSAGTTLATWTLGSGFQTTVDCVAFAFGKTPGCAPGLLTTDPTDPTVVLQGALTFNGITAGFQGSLDLKTLGIQFALLHAVTVSPASGVTLTLTTLAFSGTPHTASSLQVVAKGTAVVPMLGATATRPLIATLTDSGGSLVVAMGGISLRSLGVPLTGLFAYASTKVATFTAGPTLGKVTLEKGFDGFAVYHPTAGVTSVLQTVGFTLPPGDAVTFAASWAPGASPTFVASLAAPTGGIPFLTLPGGGSVTGATLSYAAGKLSLGLAGTVPVPGATPATIALALTVGPGGAFSGSATVSNLTVFGQHVGLVGTVSRSTTGAVTASISSCQPTASGCTTGPIPGPFTPFTGVPFQLRTVSFSLGTAGLAVAATMSLHTLGSLSVTGTLTSLSTWSVAVHAAAAHSWSPVPGVTFSPAFAGSVTDASGEVSFALTASGAGGQPLFRLSPAGVTVAVTSVGLGDAAPPKGCTVKKLGDLWLSVSGSLGLSLASTSGTVTATGCFDLTSGDLTLTASVADLSFSALTGHLSFGAPTVVVSETTGAFRAKVDATLTVSMPSGGSLVVRATVDFEPGGNFVIGAEVNLSQWLGTAGDTAYLYYASKAVTGFDTGDPTLHKVDLTAGLNFALAISLPSTVIHGLSDIGIHLPTGTGLTALGTANFSTDTYQLTISVTLGSGAQLFTAAGTSLLLDSGFLQVTLSPSNVQFGLGLHATLHVPPPGSGDKPSTVLLTGELSISTTGINVSMSLGRCGTTATGWTTAFGVSGLTVQCAALQGGITFEPPFINVGLAGTITSLPSVISTVTGYQAGAPISFAFNLDPFLLSLSIGTKNSTTPALEPLSFIHQNTLIKVYYASLYISPQGATVGTTNYPAGISLGFQATLFHVNVSILASIGLSPPSITFTATVSKITVGPLSIGPVSLVLKASQTNFEFRFTGTTTLGPGSTMIGTDLRVGGKLSASVQVTLSKTGFSAFIWGTMALTVTVYVGQTTCWTSGFIPYTCNYHWVHTGFSATLAKTGFSVTSTGVTLEADGYSVTFDYSGSVSISTAFVRPFRRGVAGTVPMTLAGTQRPVDPVTGKPIPKKGVAVLVPTPPSGSSGTGTGTGTAPTLGGPASGAPSMGAAPLGASATMGRWSPTGSMPQGRTFGAVADLHDGDVLVAGGLGAGKSVLASADLYDPAAGTWSPVGSLNTPRVGASAVVLADGDVLVAGGYGPDRQPLRSAELYHPATGAFTRTGSMAGARAFAGAALLPDGDVLVLGGEGAGHAPLRSAELYDPATGTFSATASLATGRAFPAVAALPGGGVLAAGGTGATGTLASAERYDPSTGTWSSAGQMSGPRTMSSATVLRGGDVLVVGDAAAADRYDPAANRWTQTQGMAVARTMPAVASLPDGRVLVAGGQSMGTAVATAEVYEPATMAWLGAGAMSTARAGAATAVLSNGEVLVAGGGDLSGPPGGKPTVRVESSSELFAGPTASNAMPPRQVAAAQGALPPPAGFPLLALVVALLAGGGVVALPAGLLLERRRRRTGRTGRTG